MSSLFLSQPGIFLLITALLLAGCRKYYRLFSSLTVLTPVAAFILLSCQEGYQYIQFWDLWTVSFEYNYLNKIICKCLLLASFAINVSVLNLSKHSETINNSSFASMSLYKVKTSDVIFATIYLGSSITAILAADFLTLACSFEIMMLASSGIIFERSNNYRLTLAYRYLITHFFSGSLILAGSIILAESYGFKIVSLTTILVSHKYSINYLGSAVLLTGLLINVACPPFSKWLTDTYSNGSGFSSAYLSILTTKVSLIWILKLFLGLKFLIFIGIFMSIFGLIYSILENHIRKATCYSSISKFGIIITPIGFYNSAVTDIVVALCLSHILYKALIMLSFGWLEEKYNLVNFSDIDNGIVIDKNLLIGILIGLASIIGFPFLNAHYSKILLSELYVSQDANLYNIVNIFAAAQLLIIPWFKLKNIKIAHPTKEFNRPGYYSIFLFCVFNVLGYFLLTGNALPKGYLLSILQQLTILTAGLTCFYIIRPRKLPYELNTPEISFYWSSKKFSTKLIDKLGITDLKQFNLSNFFKNFEKIPNSMSKYKAFFELSSVGIGSTVILIIITIAFY